MIKYFFKTFSYLQKCCLGIIKKREEFQKEAKEKYQNLSEEKKKKPNMQVKFIKIFSKKEKVKTENIVVNAINLSDGEKQ